MCIHHTVRKLTQQWHNSTAFKKRVFEGVVVFVVVGFSIIFILHITSNFVVVMFEKCTLGFSLLV